MSITEASPLPRRSTGSGPVATTRKLLSIARYARSRDYPSFFVHMTSVAPRLGFIRAPLQPFWVLSHPELVHEVLVTRGSVMEKGPTAGILNGLLGEGLVTAPRAIQRSQRRLIQPAFHRDRLRGYEDQMRIAGLELAAQWRDGDVVTLEAEMSELTLRVVGRALFGDDLTEEVASVSGGLSAALEQIGGWVGVPGSQRYPSSPLPGARRLRAATTELRAVVTSLAASRRALLDSPGYDVNTARPDLLTDLLLAQEQSAEFTDNRLTDELLTLLLAGHETTAMVLTWTWLLLASHPDVLGRLYAEIDAAQDDADPNGDLPFTRAVIAESMRLRPAVWAIERMPREEITLDGRHIPAGGPLRMSQYAIHRDARFWRDPLAFDPARWLSGGVFALDAPGQPAGAYFPFAAASRVCIGEHFAWSEGVLLLASLARRFDVAPLVAGMPGARPSVTLRPSEPVRVRLRAR